MDRPEIRFFRQLSGIALLIVLFGPASVLAQPADNRIVAPSRAFAGGQLVGVVVDAEGAPVANVPVQVSSMLSGVVFEAVTEDDGTFTAEVPEMEEEAEDESINIGIVGLAATLSIGLITSLPDDAPLAPPDYMEVGREFEIVGNWPHIVFERGSATTPMRELFEIPVGRAISPDGGEALTTYYASPRLPVGSGGLVLTGPDGETWQTQTHVYNVVSSSLDQEELSSGQETEFVYEFDFGEGEEREVPITVDIEGPIRYEMNGVQQSMLISPAGLATYAGSIQAIQGSPTGIPFSINALVGFAAGTFTDDQGNAWNYCSGRCFLDKRTITNTDGRRVDVRSRSRSGDECTCDCVLFDMSTPGTTTLVEEDQTYDDEGELEGSEWVTINASADYSCRCVDEQ